MQIYEFIVYGIEIIDINYKKLKFSLIESQITYSTAKSIYLPDKVIDGYINNIVDSSILINSCIGLDGDLEELTLTFEEISAVYQIGLISIAGKSKLK